MLQNYINDANIFHYIPTIYRIRYRIEHLGNKKYVARCWTSRFPCFRNLYQNHNETTKRLDSGKIASATIADNEYYEIIRMDVQRVIRNVKNPEVPSIDGINNEILKCARDQKFNRNYNSFWENYRYGNNITEMEDIGVPLIACNLSLFCCHIFVTNIRIFLSSIRSFLFIISILSLLLSYYRFHHRLRYIILFL